MISHQKILSAEFFARPTLQVARDLIGCFLVHQIPGAPRMGRIVETEAYTSQDPACHAWHLEKKRQGKNIPQNGKGHELFGPPGKAYVYLNYGMYWLMNVVTEPIGMPGAVLIRALEPILGIDFMQQARGTRVRKREHLTNGPGKLTIAMGINKDQNGIPVTQSPLFFQERVDDPILIKTSPRIGISVAQENLWRFYDGSSTFVS